MNEAVSVMASISVDADCPMYGLVEDSDSVSFVFGRRETFDVGFNTESLRQFIRLATDGLREIEQRQAEELAGAPEREERTRLTVPEELAIR